MQWAAGQLTGQRNYLDIEIVARAWGSRARRDPGDIRYPPFTRPHYPVSMGALKLEELSAKNAVAANNLSLKPGQEQFIAPVSYAMAGPFLDPNSGWSRVVTDEDDGVVGFIMANFDPDALEDEFRSCIWRMNVDADAQGKGAGRFVVEATAEEARKRGFDRLTVLWEPGDDSPEDFFLRVGFVVVGETPYGEKIGALAL